MSFLKTSFNLCSRAWDYAVGNDRVNALGLRPVGFTDMATPIMIGIGFGIGNCLRGDFQSAAIVFSALSIGIPVSSGQLSSLIRVRRENTPVVQP